MGVDFQHSDLHGFENHDASRSGARRNCVMRCTRPRSFSGSFGGKDIIPIYRDRDGTPNVASATLYALTSIHRAADSKATAVVVEGLFAYVYAVLAGADYTSRFADALETPGPRIPITADPDLFAETAALGQELLWLHTFAERCRNAARDEQVPRKAEIQWSTPVTRLPETSREFSYDPMTEELRVADGILSGVRTDVWAFDVSGMPVLRKWLGYRTKRGAGRAASSSSPLDAIRPTEWSAEWSDELLDVVNVLTRTLDLQPRGVELLDRILAGPLDIRG